MLIGVRATRVRWISRLHVVSFEIVGKNRIGALFEPLERQKRTGRLQKYFEVSIKQAQFTPLTQANMEKKEKAMAARTLLTPTPKGGSAALAH